MNRQIIPVPSEIESYSQYKASYNNPPTNIFLFSHSQKDVYVRDSYLPPFKDSFLFFEKTYYYGLSPREDDLYDEGIIFKNGLIYPSPIFFQVNQALRELIGSHTLILEGVYGHKLFPYLPEKKEKSFVHIQNEKTLRRELLPKKALMFQVEWLVGERIRR